MEMSEGDAAIAYMKLLGSYLIENFPEEVEKHKDSKSPVDLAISILESKKTIN